MTGNSSFENLRASDWTRSSTERIAGNNLRRTCEELAVLRSDPFLEFVLKVNLVQSETFWCLKKSGAIEEKQSSNCTWTRNIVELQGVKGESMEHFVNASTQTVKQCSKCKNLSRSPPQSETLSCQSRPLAPLVDGFHEEKQYHRPCRRAPLILRPGEIISGQSAWMPIADSQFNRATDVMERFLLQRSLHKGVLAFGDFSEKGVGVEHLFDLVSSETSGQNVSCISWSKELPHILVAGHGDTGYPGQQKGLISCWSLKNPARATWTAMTTSGVTAVDFSAANPNSLAVGLHDGSVFVVDINTKVRKKESGNTRTILGKHGDPVGQVRWVRRKLQNDEILVSISTDGRIIQWDVKRQGEQLELMRLGGVDLGTIRTNTAKHVSGGNVHSKGKGICFDFSRDNASVYVVGMENGMLHRCSCSSSEQYLNSYLGHRGPVYQVCWSYHSADIFISASADWTIKLWRERSFQPIFTFNNAGEQVSDVCWSPSDSTAFACSTTQGKLEVWDISISILKPASSLRTGGTISCATLSTKLPAIATGGADGKIRLFCMRGGSARGGSASRISKVIDQQSSSFIALFSHDT